MKKLVLATGNQGKVKEMANIIAQFGFDVEPQNQYKVSEVPETGTTFIENAIIKARHAAKVTGLPAIADDSGLEVDALNGAPGVYSARYAGESANDQSNIDKLLDALKNVDDDQRSARFHCVLVYMQHGDDPTPIVCHGVWEGKILEQPQGDGGFGYDPVFWCPEDNCSAAQLDAQRKKQLSHRGKALDKLFTALSASQMALSESQK